MRARSRTGMPGGGRPAGAAAISNNSSWAAAKFAEGGARRQALLLPEALLAAMLVAFAPPGSAAWSEDYESARDPRGIERPFGDFGTGWRRDGEPETFAEYRVAGAANDTVGATDANSDAVADDGSGSESRDPGSDGGSEGDDGPAATGALSALVAPSHVTRRS